MGVMMMMMGDDFEKCKKGSKIRLKARQKVYEEGEQDIVIQGEIKPEKNLEQFWTMNGDCK